MGGSILLSVTSLNQTAKVVTHPADPTDRPNPTRLRPDHDPIHPRHTAKHNKFEVVSKLWIALNDIKSQLRIIQRKTTDVIMYNESANDHLGVDWSGNKNDFCFRVGEWCMCMCMCMCMRMCMCMCMCMCMPMCRCLYIYVYDTHICTHKYIHKHTHTHCTRTRVMSMKLGDDSMRALLGIQRL